MANAPAFQMYAADIYMDTNEWSAEAFGIYNRLLNHQWVNGSIPKDHKTLAQITFVSIKKFSKSWPEMASKFVYDETNRGVNLKLENVRQKQKHFLETQKVKAKKRWGKDDATAHTTEQATAMPQHMPEPCLSSSSSISSSNNLLKATDLVSMENQDLNPASLKTEEPPEEQTPDEPDEREQMKAEFMSSLKETLEKTKTRYPDPRQQQEILVFVQANLRFKHPKAILKSIDSLIRAPDVVKAIPAYLDRVIRIEDGKFNAEDEERKCNYWKNTDTFGEMLSNIGRPMQ